MEDRQSIWEQIANKKEEYIGGVLLDHECDETIITDITFEDGFFTVEGEDYNCGLNREYGGVSHNADYDLTFEVPMSALTFSIAKPQ